jgi:hypothetical protein
MLVLLGRYRVGHGWTSGMAVTVEEFTMFYEMNRKM